MSIETKNDELQFESATPAGAAEASSGTAAVACASCHGPIAVDYYDLNGNQVCRTCRVRLLQAAETPTGMGALARAGVFGIGAMIAGAVLYYAVIAITDFEIGLVAIAIGYMVGYAVRAGARGGGRRFQVLAVVLTYLSVSLAYAGLAIGAAIQSPAGTDAVAKDTRSEAEPTAGPAVGNAAPETVASDAVSEPTQETGTLTGLFFLLGFSLAIPVMVVFTTLPGGLISGAIIAFGMMQAWRMTASPVLDFLGPYKIGSTATTTVA